MPSSAVLYLIYAFFIKMVKNRATFRKRLYNYIMYKNMGLNICIFYYVFIITGIWEVAMWSVHTKCNVWKFPRFYFVKYIFESKGILQKMIAYFICKIFAKIYIYINIMYVISCIYITLWSINLLDQGCNFLLFKPILDFFYDILGVYIYYIYKIY